MFGAKTVACVIPARLKSSRFPKKVLALLKNKPLLEWVWDAANKVPYFDEITFAIDAEETADLIAKFGGNFHMTDVSCLTGTDRLIELQKKKLVKADIWVNWQGDEPFINRKMIEDLLQSCDKDPADVWTLKKKIHKLEEINAPHIPKVVCDNHGMALYFSRCPIPFYRDPTPDSKKQYFKHIGLYAFSNKALKQLATFTPSYLELAESLEQLRFLSNGLKVRVHETDREAFGIDLPEHLAKAVSYIDENLV